jgi:hypothetical protein
MVDGEDFDFPENMDLCVLFPEYYYPSVSFDNSTVDINLVGGKARFIVRDAEIECFFEFYEEDDKLYENNEILEEEGYTTELVAYVADKLSEVLKRKVTWSGA